MTNVNKTYALYDSDDLVLGLKSTKVKATIPRGGSMYGPNLIEKSIILLYAKDAALGSMIERRAPTLKSSWMFTNFMAQ